MRRMNLVLFLCAVIFLSPNFSSAQSLSPIREVSVRVGIWMERYVLDAKTGLYDHSVKHVCDINGTVDLYDARGRGSFAVGSRSPGLCKFDIDGVRHVVGISSYAVLTDHRMFPSDPMSPMRLNVFDMFVQNDIKPEPAFGYVSGRTWTRDLSGATILTATNDTGMSCVGGKCTPNNEIVFSATVEFGP